MNPHQPRASTQNTAARLPSLQLAPSNFFAELLDQYLLAILYGQFYESLAAESRQRPAHMELPRQHVLLDHG